MDSLKPKVVLLLIPNLNFGGAQRVFYNVSLELSKHYRVVECVFNFDAGHVFQSGNEVLSLDVDGGKTTLGKLWKFFLRCRRLNKIKRTLKPDICISHLEGADLVNVLSGGGGKTIIWVHGSKRYDENISGFIGFIRHRLLIPLTYKKADKVVTVSKAIKEELLAYYGVNEDRVEPIYNYFDIDDIVTRSLVPLAPHFLPAFENRPVLIFSGRLVRQKNPNEMLSWFATFCRQVQCKLVIIGDGDLRESLVQWARELGLKTYAVWSEQELHAAYDIYFLGFQENPFQFIKRADVFILPSSWEGFPMALGEAMACGVPVVSADCPTGPKEMLIEGDSKKITYPYFAEYGLLLPLLKDSTFSIWKEAISELLNSKERIENYAIQAERRAADFSKKGNSIRVIELVKSL